MGAPKGRPKPIGSGHPSLAGLTLGPTGPSYSKRCLHHGVHSRWSIRQRTDKPGRRSICLLCEADSDYRRGRSGNARWRDRARKAAGPGPYRCEHCPFMDADLSMFDLDHITPRHAGGPDTPDNLQLLCPTCHRRKTLTDGSWKR